MDMESVAREQAQGTAVTRSPAKKQALPDWHHASHEPSRAAPVQQPFQHEPPQQDAHMGMGNGSGGAARRHQQRQQQQQEPEQYADFGYGAGRERDEVAKRKAAQQVLITQQVLINYFYQK